MKEGRKAAHEWVWEGEQTEDDREWSRVRSGEGEEGLQCDAR